MFDKNGLCFEDSIEYYSDQALIRELEARGYVVKKGEENERD